MDTYQTKSPCCGARERRFGGRRRQCPTCSKTRRIRKKKRGRKTLRASDTHVVRYLRHEIPSLYARAQYDSKSASRLKCRLRASRDRFLRRTPWPPLPVEPPLIVVADAMIQRVDGAWHAVYFILIRKVGDCVAMTAPPFIQKGAESYGGWKATFAQLPSNTRTAIKAIVCDGRVGLIEYAREQDWIIQRCHFHLLARLQGHRSRRRYAHYRQEAWQFYRLIQDVLSEPQEKKIKSALIMLDRAAHTVSSKDLRSVLSGFVKNYHDYRTYLTHPELHLPKTSNATESLISGIRALAQRARGFRTVASLMKWTAAFLKNKRTFTCNGDGNYQPN